MDIITLCNLIAKGVSSPTLLDEGCSPAPPDSNAYTSDPKNIIRAFTLTLNPKHHGTSPRHIRQEYRNVIKDFVCKTKKGIYIRTHYEFTQAMVLHMHGYICGRPTSVAHCFSALRRIFGFLLVKTPYDLMKWLEYCNKENAFPYTIHYAPSR